MSWGACPKGSQTALTMNGMTFAGGTHRTRDRVTVSNTCHLILLWGKQGPSSEGLP